MATSPSWSPSSSTSKFARLPVVALRDKIVEKIQLNRVTLIVGETGCGKSSQVPQFLLEDHIAPILCTQPRRFAVVAVARMVAEARGCQVGGEVGYHIGHSKVFSERSKIIFKTAGVLLDELREKGLNALKYKVIILDEVHERSVESDLVLVCLKQFLLRKNDLRVVLMSATADIERYRDYFRDLGRNERVEVLAIPSSGQETIFQRRVSYLKQVNELLGTSPESSDLLSLKFCSGPIPSMPDADIHPNVHNLIHDLVLHIHKNEPDIEKSILVFLPTYHSLEQQWSLLKPLTSIFKVHILHRSVDTEQAFKAMEIWKSSRKIILATNIAESSVTIPKVAYVIDSCRSLQVYWDNSRKTDSAELVWVSKSQAEQRRGRTGRTCDGHIYRLVTKSFFGRLQEYEAPAILRLSLRQQLLQICSAESKAINDPKALLQKALDPPDPDVVEDALGLLVSIRALEKPSPRGRYEPTFYGRVLASFSLSFDASMLILNFGDVGMLREGILIGVLMDTQPLPIIHPFGEETLYAEYIDNFYSGDCNSKMTGLTGRKELVFMANLCAYQFWQCVFADKHRLEQLFNLEGMSDTLFLKVEEEWCLFHNLVQSSLYHVAEMYEDVLNSLHRFRPKSLVTSNSLPSYYEPYEFQHECHLQCMENVDIDAFEEDAELSEPIDEEIKCVAVPFVTSNHFQATEVAEKFAAVIKAIRIQYTEDISGSLNKFSNNEYRSLTGGRPLCRFFVNGFCNRGSQCLFSHSLRAKPPVCKYFFTLQGCRNGDSCVFSHDFSTSSLSCNSSLCIQESEVADAASLLHLFPRPEDGCILVLDDTDFYFSSYLSNHYDASSIVTTTSLADGSLSDPAVPTGVRVLWGLLHPFETIVSKSGENKIPWDLVKCILWFPRFENDGESWEGPKNHMKIFFKHLAIQIWENRMHEVQVILTMNNVRFSQLQVEKLGRDCFFFLKESFPFDEVNLGECSDDVKTKKSMVPSRPTSYVFNVFFPASFQAGDFTTIFRQRLLDK